MTSDLSSLLYLIFLYALINLAVRKILRQPLISAALAFWFGWFFLIGASTVVLNKGWLAFSLYSIDYLELLFHGAFLGFLLGSLAGSTAKSQSRYQELVRISDHLLRVYSRRVLIALFVVGGVFFLQRIAAIGFSADYLSDVRDLYNERQGSFLLRIGSHLSVLMGTIMMLRGVYDSYYGVNIRMLSVTILAGAPLGLASGGRAFLMSYMLAYLVSLILCRSHFTGNKVLLHASEVARVGGILSILLFTFAFMGFLRGGYGEELNVFYTILIWPVSTLYAMDSWINAALTSPQTYGLHSFGWIADLATRLKLIDASQAAGVLRDVLFFFEDSNNSARVIPRSILPDLILDFGEGSLMISIAVVAFLLEFVTSRYPGCGVFLHALSAQCLLASFATIQNSVVTPGFAVSLFWAAVLAYLVHKGRSKIFGSQ